MILIRSGFYKRLTNRSVSIQIRHRANAEIVKALKENSELSRKVRRIFTLMWVTIILSLALLAFGLISYPLDNLLTIPLDDKGSILALWSFTGGFSILVIVEMFLERKRTKLVIPFITKVKLKKKINYNRRLLIRRLLLILGILILTAWFQLTD
ncbi:hypothetical protein ACNAN0_02100 [Agrilactobacillus fermenti]|uniref:hypothetical protein n=1 Tax=Agrilactobacillus fermenti TaxID=2586909 RepID=UPI003A5BD13D